MTAAAESRHPGRWWQMLPDGRMQCDLCPRECRLHDGQRGLCFVRRREGDAMLLTTYGRSSGFCIDPDREEAAQPLPARQRGPVLRHRGLQPRLQVLPELGHQQVARDGHADGRGEPRRDRGGRRSRRAPGRVAFTYNDPVIFAEYAMDVADACHARGVKTVAVTAGYISPRTAARVLRADGRGQRRPQGVHRRLLREADRRAGSRPVLDTLRYVRHETDCWLEITTLLIPGKNDSDDGARRADALGGRGARPRRPAALHGVPSRLEARRPPRRRPARR